MIDSAMLAWLFWVSVGVAVGIIALAMLLDRFFPIGKERRKQ